MVFSSNTQEKVTDKDKKENYADIKSFLKICYIIYQFSAVLEVKESEHNSCIY